MTAQEIGLKVDTGQAESTLNKTAAAAENLEGKLQGVVDGTQAAGTAIEKLGSSAGTADTDLADLTKTINTFLVERGKLAGKAPRLLDTKQDQQALQELKQQFQEMLNTTPSIRTDVLAANKGKTPSVPSQVNMAGYSPDPKKQADLMERMLTRLLSHNLATGKPIDTGLSAVDLNLRSLSRRPHEELDTPDPIKPKKPQSRDDENSRGLFRAASHIPGRFMASGIGGVAGEAAGAAVQGATSGMGAFAGGGMAGLAAGAGIGLLGYGVYKGASALSEGVDKNKVEATETDKFKRSMGATSDAFDKLIQQSRMVGDAFLLTYDQSRKLSIEFANMAKVNDTKQVKEGAGLAQAVGVDESQGVDLMATMRRDKSMGTTQQDARIMAVQFAEALKRTGSTLNANELMSALKSFSTGTAHASLGTANMEGFAGILSAMVGSKTPGLDVGNSAGILNQADAAFRSGGMMGEASQAEQFAVLVGRGQENGLMQLKQRQAGGLYATEADTVGNKNSPVNLLMGRDQAYLDKHQGTKTGIEQLAAFANSKEDREVAIQQFANSWNGGDVNRAAVLMRLQKEGHLGDNFDDDLELHRLHMTDDLKREGNVPDAQRAYNAGPDKSKWSNKETTAYVGKIEAARVSPLSEVKKQVVVQPASERAPIPTVVAAVNSPDGKAAMATANAIVADSARRRFAATDERRLDNPPEAPAPKVASIVPQETPRPRPAPVDAPAVKVASMTPDAAVSSKEPAPDRSMILPPVAAPKVEPQTASERAKVPVVTVAASKESAPDRSMILPDTPSARIPGDRSMILPPEPVQLPSGNPQEQASNSRTQMDFSPLRVEGKFTLADQAGNQKADPIPYSGTFRRSMASGQQTMRA